MLMFPKYRKYAHEKTFYKVESEKRMIELSVLGSKYREQVIEAKILPDRNFIMDVIVNEGDFLIEIDADEFERFYQHCLTNYTPANF